MSHVLLIDDEPGMEHLVEMVLGELGAEVEQVANLAGALDAARRRRPDAVLLDINLGTEDGLAILDDLRNEPSLATVPIVVFSVHDSRRPEAFDRGVVGFVRKPFKADALKEELARFLT